MKKDTLRGIVGLGVLLILYILIAFLIPFAKTATYWVSFVFTLIAFCVVAASIYIAFVKNPDAKSRFYGFPIARIGVIYGVVQLVAGLLLMALGKWVPVWLAALVYAIGLGAAVIGLISADAVAEQIHIQDAKLKKDVAAMRAIQSKLSVLPGQCEDPVTAKCLTQLAEEIRFSDPVSSEATQETEADLNALTDELQKAVLENDTAAAQNLCKRCQAVLMERNRLCKLEKCSASGGART
ncbi:MAG: hypothetical protein PT958_02290 [Firmicutes bacterium]|nr:hypothetical protein [Bacillota bacterium]